MTSDRQTMANRANARRSTGPRSQTGKAAARLNALRHGLAASLQLEPGPDEEIEKLARAIAGEEGGSELLGLARRFAEAEMIVRRVRRARMMLPDIPRPPAGYRTVVSQNSKLFRSAVSRLNRRKQSSFEELAALVYSLGWNPDLPDLVKVPFKRRAKDVQTGALERYERRALSRRKFAIRDFDAALAAAAARGGLVRSLNGNDPPMIVRHIVLIQRVKLSCDFG